MSEFLEFVLEKVLDRITRLEKRLDGLETAEYNHVNKLYVTDGITAPSAETNWAQVYVDTADGKLTVKYDDNTTQHLDTQDTTYTAGNGLSLSGATFDADYGGDGAATTLSRSDHTHSAYNYTAGVGLSLSGATFDVDFSSEGLEVGSPSGTPSSGQIFAADDIRTAAGLSVGSTGTNPGTGDIVLTGDVYTTDWTDYSASSTVSGWSSTTVKTILYKKVGDLVFCQFAIQGTSNSTSASFTLADSTDMKGSGQSIQVCVYGIDNGSPLTPPARLDIPATGSTFNVYKDLSAATWTASGTKGIRGEFFYEAT